MPNVNLLYIALFASMVFYSQEPGDPSASKSAVLAVIESAREAVQNCQIEEYSSYWDKEATIFTTNGTALWPISKYLDVWEGVCKSGGGIKFAYDEPEIWVNGNAALVVTTVHFSFTGTDLREQSGYNRYTAVLRNTGFGWKFLHAHGSDLIIPDN